MRVLLAVAGLFLAFPVVFFIAVNVLASDEKTDCTKVSDPTPGAWQKADFDARNRIVVDLSLCERLQGRSQAEVEALLGAPTQSRPGELRYELPAGGAGPQNAWLIYVGADGRVKDTRYVVPTPQ